MSADWNYPTTPEALSLSIAVQHNSMVDRLLKDYFSRDATLEQHPPEGTTLMKTVLVPHWNPYGIKFTVETVIEDDRLTVTTKATPGVVK